MIIKQKIGRVFALLMVAGMMCPALSCCSGSGDDGRNVVYDDMRTAFEQSGLISANIGIFSRTENDSSVSFGECGSGVIIRRDGDN